jgi:hypothetical protein
MCGRCPKRGIVVVLGGSRRTGAQTTCQHSEPLISFCNGVARFAVNYKSLLLCITPGDTNCIARQGSLEDKIFVLLNRQDAILSFLQATADRPHHEVQVAQLRTV